MRATSRENAVTWYDLLTEAMIRKDNKNLFAWNFAEKQAVLLRSSQLKLAVFGWINGLDGKFFQLLHSYIDKHAPDHQQKTRYELLKLPDLDQVQSSFIGLMELLSSGQLLSDEGFKVLIRTEWVAFGHRFPERNGIYGKDTKPKPRNLAPLTDDPRAFTDSLRIQRAGENERSPIFLQFLDAVHQLLHRFPTAFQFNDFFLIELARHAYSGLVGPFIFNSLQESREESEKMHREVISVWQYIDRTGDKVTNALYDQRTVGKLPTDSIVNNVRLWSELYNNTLFDEVIPFFDFK
ncbi:hypothetical protein ANCCEY_00566 [Ancylostoma ceylanicum]|uniref:Myotubularin phosphatase domain-containing protein n=1 Tax=Ancylostoma ceylanicum TaxID=53326 RepID=A0A0D6M849_9BILA|nr:hypothetical protein ANCCEY_00566 [Ancylostoma ceylanicum]